VIRSGNGISHSEEIGEKSEIFQIWFDPDISKTLNIDATYDDYKLNDFELIESDNYIKKIIKGDSSPLKLLSENININEFYFNSGDFKHKLNLSLISSIFVIDGEGQFNNQQIKKGDFIIIEDEETLNIKSDSHIKLFEITSPKKPSYPTYFERFG
jgi:redox-sensitive bicupin YhaK (pirin superfamily)